MGDPVKPAIAQAVQKTVAKFLGGYDEPLRNADGAEADKVEVSSIDLLNTQIRVTFQGGGGPRYFLVKVSEQI